MHHTPRSHTRRNSILTTGILALISASGLAQTWTGGGDGVSWNQAANWSVLPVIHDANRRVLRTPSIDD